MDNYNYEVNSSNQDNHNNDMNHNMANKPATSHDHFGLLSLIFGIISIFSFFIFYISLIFSVSSIVLAVLSRSRAGRFEGKAVAGLCLSIAGIVVCLFFFILLLSAVKNPDFINYLNQFYNTAN